MKEGYKKTEVGVIPEDWNVVEFFDIVSKTIDFRGRTPKKLGFEWGNGDILALSANNVKMGKIDFNIENYFASEELYNKWMCGNELSKGDILMTMEAPLGNVTLVPDDRKYILSQRVIALKTQININNKFIMYLLMSDFIQNQLNLLSTGTTAKGINQKNLSKVRLIIPPFKEQKKIAEILSTVDCQIDDTEKLIEKCEELKKGLMQRLLSRGIGHSEFKKSEVGEIPASWEVKKLGEITKKIQDGNYGNSYPKNEEFIEDGVPFITSAAIGDSKKINEDKIKYISINKHMELSKAHVEIDDVLFTNRGANSGEVALVTKKYDGGNIGPQLTLLRSDKNIIISKYLFYYLQSNMMIKQFNMNDGGSAMNFFSISTTKSFKISYPNLEEQNKIAEILSSVDNEIEEYRNKKENLEELKKGLMQQLLAGKIRTI